ncbi:hypothetical protein [Streptomyces sp. HSG2]|uniref:hypothetical protein n=1 Tax=Streptomyces sp. HSG2 TaxID=2797167 RepID=UPI001F5B4295|nr:hypothetical protein [Streptomyces sp. HSG2]
MTRTQSRRHARWFDSRVQQPHVACILTGAKGIEDRSRPRTIRGRELTTGVVLGIARLVDCHQDPEGSAGRFGCLKLRNECQPMARCARFVHALGTGTVDKPESRVRWFDETTLRSL